MRDGEALRKLEKGKKECSLANLFTQFDELCKKEIPCFIETENHLLKILWEPAFPFYFATRLLMF